MKDKRFLLLALICAVTLLPFLGMSDFHTKGEPREAIVAYSMLESSNWILPINNGGDIAYKPPFFHWCIAAISSVVGEVNEYTSRMPSALALIGMVLTGFLFYAKRRGTELAFLMGVITLTNFEVHRAGYACRVDMVLTVFIVLALYALYRWCEKGRTGFPWLATVYMGCAALTKGPIGIILPCLVTGVYLLLRNVRFPKAFLSMVLVGIASCILPALWYIAAYQQGGDNFIALVMEENFGRFMGKMSYESHENPAWYNVMTVVSGYAPYTLLALISLFSLKYTRLSGKPREWWERFTAYIRNMDDVRLFSLLSIVLIFVFYCIPKSKRSVYLLPIYPFIAYFLAEYIVWLIRKGSRAVNIYGGILATLGILLTVVFAVVKGGLVPESIFQGKRAAENIAYMDALKELPFTLPNLLLILLPLLAGINLFLCLRRKLANDKTILYLTLSVTFAIFMALDGVYQPAVLNVKSDKQVALQLKERIPEGELYSYVSVNMLRFFTINFYHGDRVALFENELPAEGYLLVGQKDFKLLQPKYEGQYTFEEVMNTGKRSCDTRDVMMVYRFLRK